MSDKTESRRRQGPVTVLALLFGLLLGVAGGGAQASADPNHTRVGQGEVARAGTGLRLSGRSQAERPDADDSIALLPPPASIHRELLSARPIAATVRLGSSANPLDPHLNYYARAPPAA